MRIKTAIDRKRNATSELAPSTFALSGDNFESSIYAPPQSTGHSFSNLSVVQPPAKLTAGQSGDHFELEAEQLSDQMTWMGDHDAKLKIPQIGPNKNGDKKLAEAPRICPPSYIHS